MICWSEIFDERAGSLWKKMEVDSNESTFVYMHQTKEDDLQGIDSNKANMHCIIL